MDPPSWCESPQNDDALSSAESIDTKSERGSCWPAMEDAPSCAFTQNAPSCAATPRSSSNDCRNRMIVSTICEVITFICAIGKAVVSNKTRKGDDDTEPRNTRDDHDEEAPVIERRKKVDLEEKSQEAERMALEREKLELQRKAEERQTQQVEMQRRAEEERILAIDLEKCQTEALRTYYAALQQQILARINNKHGI